MGNEGGGGALPDPSQMNAVVLAFLATADLASCRV